MAWCRRAGITPGAPAFASRRSIRRRSRTAAPAGRSHRFPAAPAVPRLPLASVATGNLAAYAEAAIALAKQARLLPAVAIGLLPAEAGDGRAFAAAEDILAVGVGEVASYETLASRSLVPVSEALVPLAGAEATRIITFRPGDGGIEHLAIVIGEPGPGRPVLTRLHSACLTGDSLGSLRCDCGDQLQGAIAEIARQGSGLLLYLAQEGRGIGPSTSLRAYRLQDRGADTLEANLQLGFDADERSICRQRRCCAVWDRSVRLMTNNPEKVAGPPARHRRGRARPPCLPLEPPQRGPPETKATRFGICSRTAGAWPRPLLHPRPGTPEAGEGTPSRSDGEGEEKCKHYLA